MTLIEVACGYFRTEFDPIASYRIVVRMSLYEIFVLEPLWLNAWMLCCMCSQKGSIHFFSAPEFSPSGVLSLQQQQRQQCYIFVGFGCGLFFYLQQSFHRYLVSTPVCIAHQKLEIQLKIQPKIFYFSQRLGTSIFFIIDFLIFNLTVIEKKILRQQFQKSGQNCMYSVSSCGWFLCTLKLQSQLFG